jgi:riboflavin kinase/FMN adenylyltransferase
MEIIRDLAALKPHPWPVVALGNFDGVHRGHQEILRTAIELARPRRGVAFALTFDPNPAKVLAPERAPRMIMTPEDKLEFLRVSGIDAVLVIEFSRAFSLVEPRDFVRDYLIGRIGARGVVDKKK